MGFFKVLGPDAFPTMAPTKRDLVPLWQWSPSRRGHGQFSVSSVLYQVKYVIKWTTVLPAEAPVFEVPSSIAAAYND